MPRKLTTTNDLQDSGFGRPEPRHGLMLLYWFATECIWINDTDDMFLACNPTTGEFGFHLFENRSIGREKKLLPDVGFDYYLLGSLNKPRADMLPNYVRKHNTGYRDDSNTDRIIVTAQENRKFGNIYATTHSDRWNFDPNGTFHITRDLLKIIRSFQEVDDFLLAVKNQKPRITYQMMMVSVRGDSSESAENNIDETEAKSIDSGDTEKPRRNCGCIIL